MRCSSGGILTTSFALRIVFLLVDFEVLFLFLFHLCIIDLSLEDHVGIEFLVCVHERGCEVLVHHILDSKAGDVSLAKVLGLLSGQLLLYVLQLNMVEIGLDLELIFLGRVD